MLDEPVVKEERDHCQHHGSDDVDVNHRCALDPISHWVLVKGKEIHAEEGLLEDQ